jgi:hypothetical protein
VSVHPPTPIGSVAEHCARLADLLPQRLEALRPRVTSPRSGLVHAWGSPAVILTCGVGAPAGYSPTSSETTAVDGVRWFQQTGSSLVTWTALRPGVHPKMTINVQLVVPTHYKAQGPFLIDLAKPLKQALP